VVRRWGLFGTLIELLEVENIEEVDGRTGALSVLMSLLRLETELVLL